VHNYLLSFFLWSDSIRESNPGKYVYQLKFLTFVLVIPGDERFLPSCTVSHAVNSIFRCQYVFASPNVYRGAVTCRYQLVMWSVYVKYHWLQSRWSICICAIV